MNINRIIKDHLMSDLIDGILSIHEFLTTHLFSTPIAYSSNLEPYGYIKHAPTYLFFP